MRHGLGFVGRFRKAKRFGILVLFVFIFVFCQKDKPEFEPMLNVYCVLKSSEPYQKVIVDRTYGLDEKSIYDLEDVQVILSGNGMCDTLVEDAIYGELGIFLTSDTFPILHGKTYHLQVSAKGFDTLTGITTVPDSFEIIYPRNGDTIYGSYASVIFSNPFRNRWFYYLSYYYFDDTLLLCQSGFIRNYAGSKNFWMPITDFVCDSGIYSLVVYAVDTNFVEYYHIPSNSIPKCGIEKGIGLFGSFYTTTVDFYFVDMSY